MVLIIENLEGRRQYFEIRSYPEFTPLIRMYPMVRNIVMNSVTLEDALEDIAEYLSSHSLEAWVENDKITKSAKNKLLGAGLAAALAVPAMDIAKDPPPSLPQVNYETCEMPVDTYAPFGQHKTDPFLWTLMQIESSGGENINHPLIESGPSKGETAIGRWGLLRPTVQEIIRRQVKDRTVDPKILSIYHYDRDKMENFFKKKPHLELELARYLADRVLVNNKNHPEKGAFAWLMGHNLKNLQYDRVKNNYYVQRYREYDQANPFKKKGLQKAEADVDFETKLLEWVQQRKSQAREPQPNRNIAIDPGRQHEDQPKPKTDPLGEIQDSIDSARKIHNL